LRSYPADGCVLMGGCDKTTPGSWARSDEPAVDLRPGYRCCAATTRKISRQRIDTWKYWAELRAGNITDEDWRDVEDGIARSPGHCMTMGTASTTTSATEAMGLQVGRRRFPRRTRAMHRWRR
jgi:dihydroxy-acid dehydratase